MSALPIVRLGTVKQVERFQEHVRSLGLTIPCDRELLTGMNSPLRAPLNRGGVRIGNRITVQPMEGWDGTPDGNPSEHTIERWKKRSEEHTSELQSPCNLVCRLLLE